MTLDDIYQRDLNQKRVEQEIAPYLAKTEDRFFGAIIIYVREIDALTFESISQFTSDVKAAYRAHAQDIGFVTLNNIPGGLVALDGQHRLAALKNVVQGGTNGKYRQEVPSDEVTVIFISDTDLRKARELFTMLNKSARKVSKKDVLIMSESDGGAVVARKLTSEEVLNPRGLNDFPLVKWQSNTINQRDTQFTTLNALYEIANLAAEKLDISFDDSDDDEHTGIPPESDIKAVLEKCLRWLNILFDECEDFAEMREDRNQIVEGRRKEAPYSLLLRPVGLILFFEALVKVLDESLGGMSDEREAIKRLLEIDWRFESILWRGIMVNSKSNISNRSSDRNLASDLAVWLVCGKNTPVGFQENLRERYSKQHNRADASLPKPLEF
jgi:DNA sulfur modification protein DndB